MSLFDFLKGKKKEETKDIEIKSDSIELDDIEIELKTEENTIALDLAEQKNTTVNEAVHKAIHTEDIELYTATGGKLYQEDKKPQEAQEQETETQKAEAQEIEIQKTETQEIETQEKSIQTEEPTKEKKKGFFAKLLAGLDKTRKNIMGGVDSVLGAFTKIDEDLFEELEEVLIMADIGVETAKGYCCYR